MKNRIVAFLLFALSLGPAVHAGEPVVAVVNGVAITDRDLDEAVNLIIPQATFHGNLSEEKRDEFRGQALDSLIERELQYQDASAKGMKPDKNQVKAAMEKVRERFPSKSEYKKALEQAKLTEDGLRARVERDVLIQMIIARTVTDPARMNETALKDYYDKNLGKFKQPESVRLRVFSTKDESKAKDALARIRNGEDFGNIAARMSEDNYRIKGGDIGFIHRGRIYPALEDAAFKLKPGETSDLIRTEEMWFLVKVESKEPERLVPFDEIKDKLKRDLEKKRSSELMEQWMSALRAKATIEIKIKPAVSKGSENSQ